MFMGRTSNAEPRTPNMEPNLNTNGERRTQKRERYIHHAIALAIILVAEGHLSSQVRTATPLLPLKQTAYIKASNAEAYDYFADGGGNQGHNGNSIALSGDGSTMVVGAPYESSGSTGVNGNQNDNSAYASGAVYMFARQGSSWVQQAYIKASNADQSDHFGASVALSRDGNTLAVAAPWESSAATGINGDQNDNSLRQAGAVYVFSRAGSTWTQQAYIKASNTGRAGEGEVPGDGDQFGYSLALSGDGNTLAVGAISEDGAAQQVNGNERDDSQQSAGAAYVFVRSGTTWTEQAFIKANNPRPYNSFGVKLALSGDGNTLAVTAYLEDNAAQGVRAPERQPFLIVDHLDPWREQRKQAEESGAVYFYTRSGATWTQRAYVKGSNTEAGDEFGSAVALSTDGRIMAVGAHNEDGSSKGIGGNQADNSADDSGAVYVFSY